MIIWKGYGFAVVLFALLGIIIGGLLNDMLGTSAGWTFGLGLLLGAAANFYVARKLDGKSKTYIDPETGQPVVFKRGDSLFWIPMRYWTYVMVALALLVMVAP